MLIKVQKLYYVQHLNSEAREFLSEAGAAGITASDIDGDKWDLMTI